MKAILKTTGALVLVMALILAFAGCSAQVSGEMMNGMSSSSAAYYEPSAAPNEAGGMMDMDTAQVTINSAMPMAESMSGEKVIKTVSVEMETLEFEKLLEDLAASIRSLGGFVQSSSQSGNSLTHSGRSRRTADFCVRIPSDKLNEFLQALPQLGNVLYTRQEADDVTGQYTDYELRLKSLRTQFDRLTELLAQAEDVGQIMQIEERLSDVQYQIDSITGALNSIDDKVDLSTVDINIREVTQYQETEEPGFWDKLVSTVKNSLKQFGRGAQDLFFGLIYMLPHLLVLAVVVVLVVVLIRHKRKAAKQRKAQNAVPPKQEEQQ